MNDEMRELITAIRHGECDGQDFYICDFRKPDINKKPIRCVAPTFVQVRPNSEIKKRIYYSESHFRPYGKTDLLSKVIPLFDTTGFRSNPGTAVQVFETPDECFDKWHDQLQVVIDQTGKHTTDLFKELNQQVEAMKLSQHTKLVPVL